MAEDLKCGDTLVHTIAIDDVRSGGLLQLPVYASDNSPKSCVIVRLHQAYETLVIRWTATRVGGPPELPHPTSLDANNVFLRGGRGRITPPPDVGGVSHEWTISGWYEYAKIVPRGLDSDVLGCKLPWDEEEASEYTIPAEQFRKDLIATPSTLPTLLNPIKGGGPGS